MPLLGLRQRRSSARRFDAWCSARAGHVSFLAVRTVPVLAPLGFFIGLVPRPPGDSVPRADEGHAQAQRVVRLGHDFT